MILVTGDVVLDQNVYAGQRLTPVSTAKPGTIFDKQPGGAMLAYGLLRELIPNHVQFGLGNVSIQDLDGWPCNFHAGGLWEPLNDVWRLSKHLGYGPPSSPKKYPGVAAAGLDKIEPKILVIDDGGLGFRHRTASVCWPPFLNSGTGAGNLQWIIHKMSRPLAGGDLWRDLSSNWREKLIVVVSADNLRSEYARVSKGLSWESTVDDLIDEVQSNPTLRGLQSCRHLIITLRGEAALWFDQPSSYDGDCRLIFDRERSEGETEDPMQTQGAFGFLSATTVSLALHLWEKNESDLSEALKTGLSATQFLRQHGHGPVAAGKPGFPFVAAAAHFREPTNPYAVAEVPCSNGVCADPNADGSEWSILRRMFQSDAFPGPLFGPARRVALLGPALLENVPYARFGDLLTMDRKEIEGLRALRLQMLSYQRSDSGKRPLSLAVFGAPGSGKSFGLKQIAIAVFGKENPMLEFNLSQFKGPEDLIGAFHQIRDHALAGKTPVAFWDEFDSRSYQWLQYFLAPMQDGMFQEGQNTHAVGKSVFVFAGGTSRDFAHFGPPAPHEDDDDKRRTAIAAFRMAKGPDFKSRIKGYLDIQGPNPRQHHDENRARAGLDSWVDDPLDIDFPVRRAILLRSLLGMVHSKKRENEVLAIDRGLLTALLGIGYYRNGSRSLEQLVQATSEGGGDGVLRRAHLPPDHLLAMYVDDVKKFHELTQRSYAFQAKAERLAPIIHQDWRDGLPVGKKGKDYDVPYEDLDQETKESNVAAAQRIPEILALAGFSLEEGLATPDEEEPILAFLKQHLDFLAEEEHKGWEEQKRIDGWTYDDRRDDTKRKHPSLVPYAKLQEEDKNKDRRTIQNYPKYAREAGFKIVSGKSKPPPPVPSLECYP
jgi:RyR domain